MKYRNLTDRLLMMSVLNPATDCWHFLGCKSPDGYGHIKINGKRQLAHRVSYTQLKGLIPELHDLDHQCKNRDCINPEHLVPMCYKMHRAKTGFAHWLKPPKEIAL